MPPKKDPKKGKDAQKQIERIVEDKTFGMKNKNKSAKIQNYIQQVQHQAQGQVSGQQRSTEWYAAQAAKRKAEKEAKKEAEKEALRLLAAESGVEAKSKKKLEEEAKAEAEKKKEEALKQHEHDFAEPITSLDQVFRVESKATVNRVCAEVIWLNNLASKTKDGSKDCVFAKLSDGSMRQALPVTFIGWTPSSIPVRTGDVVDIRNALAMVRGETVDLEVTFNVGKVEKASQSLKEHIVGVKNELEEHRARGGVPIEDLIEEARAKLRSSQLTPVTKERFEAWKQKRLDAKREAEEKLRIEQESKHAKGQNVLSGRQLFAYDPSLFAKDDEEAEAEYVVGERPASESEDEGEGEGDGDKEEDGEGGEEGEEGQGEEAHVANVLAKEEDVDLDDLEDD